MTRSRKFQLSLWVILLLSIPSIKAIPWFDYWGLDFQNLYVFHRCGHPAAQSNPYLFTGRSCGDVLGRSLVYPPAMYAAFAWTRLFSFQVAYRLWFFSILLILGFAAWTWARERKAKRLDLRYWGIFILMMPQYPTVFALERGNNDALVVLAWTLAFGCFQKNLFFILGVLLGLAILVKLYPVFAVTVLLAGLLFQINERQRGNLLLALTLTLGLGFWGPWNQSQVYFFEVLPHWAKTLNEPGLSNHSILAFFPDRLGGGYGLCLTLLLFWVRSSLQFFRSDPALIFAGSLAMTTYFSGVSEDYNLLTTYPLLWLLTVRALGEPGVGPQPMAKDWRPAALALLGFISVLGNRQIFVGYSVFFQLIWLWAVALWGSTGRIDPREG